MHGLKSYLVDSIKAGDQKAFEILFKTYYHRLCMYAARYIREPEQVRSIIHDVFLHIWEKRLDLTITTSLDGYLYTSVRNHCLNYQEREKKKELSIYSDLETVLSEERDAWHPLSDDDPIDYIMVQELKDKIEKAIELLPPQCREIFVLSRMEHFTNREIAQKMNLSEGAVKSQLFRSLSKLRVALSEYFILLVCYFSFF